MKTNGAAGVARGAASAAVAVVLLMAAPASAQFRPLKGHEYREVVDPKHNVSGHLVVGLTVVDPQRTAQLEAIQLKGRKISIYVAGELNAKEQIRVDVDSPDGRFHGTGMWEIEEPVRAPGWVELTLLPDDAPTRRPPLQGGHLAVSVRLVRPGPGTGPQLVLASLLPRDVVAAHGGERELWVQVNARRAQMMVRGTGEAKPCERVTSASAVRFDALCKIAVSQLEKDAANVYRMTLLRRDGFGFQSHEVRLGM